MNARYHMASQYYRGAASAGHAANLAAHNDGDAVRSGVVPRPAFVRCAIIIAWPRGINGIGTSSIYLAATMIIINEHYADARKLRGDQPRLSSPRTLTTVKLGAK